MAFLWPLPRIVGLIGPRRVGKDTLAQVLEATEDYHPIALATPLMTLGTTLWPSGFPRNAITTLGAAVRSQDPHALIAVVLRTIAASSSDQRWVITDIRLPLEYATFRAAWGPDFAAIAITADPAVRAQRIAQSHRADGLQETPTSGNDVTETWAATPPEDVDGIWDTSDVPPTDPFSTWAFRLHHSVWWTHHPLQRRPSS